LLQGKEKNADAISARLKTSSVSPAFYYTQAAMALQQKDETGARVNFRAAQKAYPERVNRLFLESFYEIDWLAKPEKGPPTTLEVISEATRLTNAQVDFGNAERAFEHGELERALELLKNVDAIAPNQAVSYNLRGEIFLGQGDLEKAQTAFHNALQADPQFQDARLNLARIPFKKGDYAAARKELESLLGAVSGDKQQRLREQLIRYQIFLTLLREGRESAAQKAMEEFKMTDESPALYYAQAAWAYEHGNPNQGNNWMANAGNLFSPEMNRNFAKPFADLGWTAKKTELGSKAHESEAGTSTEPSPPTSRVNASAESSSPAPVVEATATPEPMPKERHPKVVANATASPVPSATPETKSEPSGKKTSRTETRTKETTTKEATTKEERPARTNAATSTKSAGRAKPVSKRRQEQWEESARSTASSKSLPRPGPTVAPQATATPSPPQNLGDKVVRLLFYPFQRHEKASPGPASSPPAGSPAPMTPPTPR
jgi:Tfp pilus assembly protein PilF